MLFLSKVLTQLIYPLTLSIGLSVLAGLLFWCRYRGLGGLCLAASLAAIWIPSTPVFADYLCTSLERNYPPKPIVVMPPADAIVVLGGMAGPALAPRLHVDLNGSIDRLLHAARLYKAGKAPAVVVSGGTVPWLDSDTTEAERLSKLLVEWQVPEKAILLEEQSRNTRENAVFTEALMEKHKFETVLLVTSALHMPRAMATFRSLGIKALPAPTDYRVVPQDMTILRWLPDAGALEDSTRAIKELLGMMVYRLRGWIE